MISTAFYEPAAETYADKIEHFSGNKSGDVRTMDSTPPGRRHLATIILIWTADASNHS